MLSCACSASFAVSHAAEETQHVKECFGLLQVQGRTKSLFSTMKKLLRLDDMAKGGRGRDEIYDLLGMRVVVAPLPGTPLETAAIAATQVSCSSVRGRHAAFHTRMLQFCCAPND